MNNAIKLLIVLFSSFVVSGCLDIDQKISIVKDDVTYIAEMKIDAKIASMSDKKSGSLCDDMQATNKNGLTINVKETLGGGNVICSIVAKGKLENFSDFSSETNAKSKLELVKIVKLDKNKYKIESDFNFDNGKSNMPGMEGMFDAMLAGRSLTWEINASKVLESNGKISEDGKNVTWSVPLSVAFKSPQKFYAVIQAESSWLDSILDFFRRIFKSIIGLFSSAEDPKASMPAPVVVQDVASATATVAVPAVETVAPASSVVSAAEKKNESAVPDDLKINPDDFKPSFDCSKASTYSEKSVCTDKILGRLDGLMASNYKMLRDSQSLLADQKKALTASQRQWNAEKNKCTDSKCLESSYVQRINDMCSTYVPAPEEELFCTNAAAVMFK